VNPEAEANVVAAFVRLSRDSTLVYAAHPPAVVLVPLLVSSMRVTEAFRDFAGVRASGP